MIHNEFTKNLTECKLPNYIRTTRLEIHSQLVRQQPCGEMESITAVICVCMCVGVQVDTEVTAKSTARLKIVTNIWLGH